MNAQHLRLLTINTWKCDGNYWQRLSLLKAQLSALQPDIIACQEVFRTEGADTGQVLADTLGMQYTFTPARCKPRLFDGQLVNSYSGLGILSKWPVLNTETVPLPAHPHDGERMAQFVWLNINGTAVLIINTHLTHLPGQSELRKQQLATLLAHPALVRPTQPVFLCGDFNAEIDSKELQFLLNQSTISVQNTYTLGKGQLPGNTTLYGNGNQPGSGRCIDFIFSLTTAGGLPPTVSQAKVVLDTPDAEGTYPSDHRGVFVRIEIPAV